RADGLVGLDDTRGVEGAVGHDDMAGFEAIPDRANHLEERSAVAHENLDDVGKGENLGGRAKEVRKRLRGAAPDIDFAARCPQAFRDAAADDALTDDSDCFHAGKLNARRGEWQGGSPKSEARNPNCGDGPDF